MAQVRVLQHDLRGALGLALSHPLYYLVAIGAQVLPVGESALKTNLVSVVFGAVTVANVCLLLVILTGNRRAAVVGTTSLAVAHTFWQHCALAEVYALTTALLTCELLCATLYLRTDKQRWLILLFLANGLGISNHLLALLGLPVWMGVGLWLLWRRRMGLTTVLWTGLAWLIGASIYLVLIGQEIVTGIPVGEALRSALFGQYAEHVGNLTVTTRLIRNSVLYLGLNFPTPVALLALFGLARLRALRPRPIAVCLAALLLIHLLWAIRYDVPDQYTFFVPSVVLIAIMIGLGSERLLRRRRRAGFLILLVLALLPVAVYFPLPRVARSAGLALGLRRQIPYRDEYQYFLRPWKTRYDGPSRFARQVRAALPNGAVLIADDTAVRPIHYLMLRGHWNPAIRVWPPLPSEPGLDVYWPEESQLSQQLESGLVYVVSPVRGYCPTWLLDHWATVPDGLVYRVIGRRPARASATAPAAL